MNPIMQLFWLEVQPMADHPLRISSGIFSYVCSSEKGEEKGGDLARSLHIYAAATTVSKFRGKHDGHVLVRGMNPLMQLFWLEVQPMAGPRLRISSEIFFYGCSLEKGGDPARSLHAYTAVILWVSRFMGKHEGHVLLVRGMKLVMQLFSLEVQPMAGPHLRISSEILFCRCSLENAGGPTREPREKYDPHVQICDPCSLGTYPGRGASILFDMISVNPTYLP